MKGRWSALTGIFGNFRVQAPANQPKVANQPKCQERSEMEESSEIQFDTALLGELVLKYLEELIQNPLFLIELLRISQVQVQLRKNDRPQ